MFRFDIIDTETLSPIWKIRVKPVHSSACDSILMKESIGMMWSMLYGLIGIGLKDFCLRYAISTALVLTFPELLTFRGNT